MNSPCDIKLENFIQDYNSIKLFYMDQQSKTIIKKNKSIIVIDNRLDPRSKRQELTEEFCHALLHMGNQFNYCNTINMEKQENQAKRMAAYLLCPLHILKKQSIPIDTYFVANELADFFGVTKEFMEYRLRLIFGQDLDVVAYHGGEIYGHIPVE